MSKETKQESPEILKKNLEIFNSSRQDLRNIMDNDLKNLSFFEEKITYLSAGAIALSLYFIEYGITYSFLYKISIFFLLITLLLNLYSYLLSVRRNKEVVKAILYTSSPEGIILEKENIAIEKQNQNNNFFSCYNEVCFCLFLIGVIIMLLSIFMLNKNIPDANKKAITPPVSTTVITEPIKKDK